VQQRPQDFRYRQEAEDYALTLRKAQAERLIRRLSEQAAAAEDLGEQQRIGALLGGVGYYVNALRRPRRSSTFPDIRDTLGRM
jgi:DNA primase